MKAPDKIYIEQKAIMYSLVNTEPCKKDDLEYIRKEAILEWAKECVEIYSNLQLFEFLIDKLNSL